MDFKAMLNQARKEKKQGNGSGESGGNDSWKDVGKKSTGFAIRGCDDNEATLWQHRGDDTSGQVPSHNSMHSGTTYALEQFSELYDKGWKDRLAESIKTCKTGGCSKLVILKGNTGFGTHDYPGLLNKVPVLETATFVASKDLLSTSAADAADWVCNVIRSL